MPKNKIFSAKRFAVFLPQSYFFKLRPIVGHSGTYQINLIQ